MASIDDIIKREVNPFDDLPFKTCDFWREQQDSALTVNSIHQEVIDEISADIDLVAKDHRSRTVMLSGDSGSGKSYLLGRLKRTLNPKAFFAYIGPWPDSESIWRHTLRYTVDSLMQVPDGQQESQLMLWLKSLSAFKQLSVKELIFNENVWNLLRSDRQKFIKKLKDTYRHASIYNADKFFGVLYHLTNPELFDLACEWLRVDELSEESLEELKVGHSIETEEAACEILANFGRISTSTQPIVLCFDQLEASYRLPDGSLDLQALFSVHSKIQNQNWQNFLMIISIATDIWKQNNQRIYKSDKAGIYKLIPLKQIALEQAEALWAFRLHPLHRQVNPQPASKIYPLNREQLEQNFPGGKTQPRTVLTVGRRLFNEYKKGTVIVTISKTDEAEIALLAAFKLVWQSEYSKLQEKVKNLTSLAATELIKMLESVLTALQVQDIKSKLLSKNSALYSLSYQQPVQKQRVGVVWTENPNMKSFCSIMKDCQKVIDENICNNLYLIREATLGNTKLVGYQIYKKIFTGSPHRHIKPTLSSVNYLATYHNLVNAACTQDLVVAGKQITLQQLENLIRKSEILKQCILLQNLGIVENDVINGTGKEDLQTVKEFLLNVVKTQNFLGQNTLIENTINKFDIDRTQIEQMIQQLCQENQIKIINPNNKPEEALVFLVV